MGFPRCHQRGYDWLFIGFRVVTNAATIGFSLAFRVVTNAATMGVSWAFALWCGDAVYPIGRLPPLVGFGERPEKHRGMLLVVAMASVVSRREMRNVFGEIQGLVWLPLLDPGLLV